MRAPVVVVIVVVAGCAPGTGRETTPTKSYEERSEDEWFANGYKHDILRKPYTSVPHPSVTGTLSENSVNASILRERGGTDIWLSVTELSDQRVCLDFGSFVTGRNPKNFNFDDMVSDVENGRVLLRSHTGRKAPLAIAETLPTEVLATWVADMPYMVDEDTGRTATQCVEDLTNQYGTVVGCARYEEVAITRKVETIVKETLIRHYGGIRMCAANDGLVPPDAPWFGVIYGRISPQRRRFELTGGIAKTGSWGAAGGRSALVRHDIKDKKVVPVSGDKPATVRATVPADRGQIAAPDKVQLTPRTDKSTSAPRSGEAELLRHGGGPLKLEAFALVAPNGATTIEVTAAGQLRVRGKLVGAIQADGIVRDADGHATHALDSSGWLWRIRDGKVAKAAKLSRNVAQFGAMSLAYKKDGSFVLSGNGRKEFPNRAKPAGISAMLALVFALSTDDVYFGTPK